LSRPRFLRGLLPEDRRTFLPYLRFFLNNGLLSCQAFFEIKIQHQKNFEGKFFLDMGIFLNTILIFKFVHKPIKRQKES